VSVTGDVGIAGLFASRLAPTFDLGSAKDLLINPIPCGSELARESGVSVTGDVGCAGLFASRLAPTLDLGSAEDLLINPIPCGSEPARESGVSVSEDIGIAGLFASRLAKAVYQSPEMLALPASSRAGSLPHLISVRPKIY
jgi:hypothetical protein